MSPSSFKSTDKPSIKILGAYGGKSTNMQLTSLQVSKEVVIDAGNILEGLGNGMHNINHVFITHSHMDHINDLGYLIDATFEDRITPLKIYARKKTIEAIHEHIFNWDIWPDFSKINLKSGKPAIEFVEIKLNEPIEVDGSKLTPIENNHTESSNGFIIEKENKALLFTSDTFLCNSIWEKVNNNKKITSVIVDISFPSRLEQLASDSKHLTPLLLKEELNLLTRDDVTIYINHIKPAYKIELVKEIIKTDLLLNNGMILESQDIVEF